MGWYSACKNCTERHAGCHGKCEKYQEFRRERDRQLEENLKQKKIVDALRVYTRRRHKKVERRNNG